MQPATRPNPLLSVLGDEPVNIDYRFSRKVFCVKCYKTPRDTTCPVVWNYQFLGVDITVEVGMMEDIN